jgi:hypothetical protein
VTCHRNRLGKISQRSVKVSLGEPGVMKYSKSNRVGQLGKVITGWGMGGVRLLNSPRFMKGIRHIELKDYRAIYHVRFFLCAVGNFFRWR